MRGTHFFLPLAMLLFAGACTKAGDEGYTALLRYGVTDFRIAGIDARLVQPNAGTPDLQAGIEVQLQAVILSARDEPVELEWVDCPAISYGADVSVLQNVDCLGTPRERRLGRGEVTVYTTQPFAPDFGPREPDGGWQFDEAGWPVLPDAGDPDAPPQPVEVDDGTVFLRATQGDQVRYGRKSFFGLFYADAAHPVVEQLWIDGQQRSLDDTSVVRRKPGAEVEVRFSVVAATEDRQVQWFVTDGTLKHHGLTYCVDATLRDVGGRQLPVLTISNRWRLSDRWGTQELVAVMGGDGAELPHVRLRIEVAP